VEAASLFCSQPFEFDPLRDGEVRLVNFQRGQLCARSVCHCTVLVLWKVLRLGLVVVMLSLLLVLWMLRLMVLLVLVLLLLSLLL
jgi:hypothetical protein